MKRFKPTLVFATLCITSMLLMSAVPVQPPAQRPEPPETAASLLQKANVDGNLSYRELKEVATKLKGSKLTIKERVALKIVNKKLSSKKIAASGGKSQVVALLLCALVGGLGIHRFYLGYTWQGVVQLLTLGGCGIWSLIDLIRIITGDLQPKDDYYETTL